jgi:hypothetical protein
MMKCCRDTSLKDNAPCNDLMSLHIQRPPLWSSGQSSWLQIQRCGLDSRRYQMFWEVVGVKLGPLRPMSTIGELLERKSGCSGLEYGDYDRRGSAPLNTRHSFIRKNLALTSPTRGGFSVHILPSWTRATEFSVSFCVQPADAVKRYSARPSHLSPLYASHWRSAYTFLSGKFPFQISGL